MRIVKLRTSEGITTAILGKPGRIYTPFVMIELPIIRKRQMPNGNVALYATDIEYPLKKACRRYLSFGRKHSITGSARKFIQGALA